MKWLIISTFWLLYWGMCFLGEGMGLFDILVIDLLWWRNTKRIRFSFLPEKAIYQDPAKHIGSFVRGIPLFAAGRALRYGNLRRQLADSLEDKPFPPLPEEMQRRVYFEFGSIEEHYKYRDAVMKTYPQGNYPVFEGYNHMQFQIRDPEGFAKMLRSIIEDNRLPELPFLKGCV